MFRINVASETRNEVKKSVIQLIKRYDGKGKRIEKCARLFDTRVSSFCTIFTRYVFVRPRPSAFRPRSEIFHGSGFRIFYRFGKFHRLSIDAKGAWRFFSAPHLFNTSRLVTLKSPLWELPVSFSIPTGDEIFTLFRVPGFRILLNYRPGMSRWHLRWCTCRV